MNPIILANNSTKGIVTTIITAGLLVGTLDITAAIIQTLINGVNPLRMLQFIASGIFGREAFGSSSFCFFGILFHYCIAMGWTILFFLLYPYLPFRRKKILIGVLYGLFVWVMMNQVVLPLSNTPPLPFKIQGSIIAALILILAIGLPLSFMASRYFSTKKLSV